MSADRFAEVERLYHEATLLRPEERAAFLDHGMGVVYLAEQEKPFRRLVALKLIKPGIIASWSDAR